MKKEYDFSKGVREKFFQPNATLNLPVYLDNEVSAWAQKACPPYLAPAAELFTLSLLRAPLPWFGYHNIGHHQNDHYL